MSSADEGQDDGVVVFGAGSYAEMRKDGWTVMVKGIGAVEFDFSEIRDLPPSDQDECEADAVWHDTPIRCRMKWDEDCGDVWYVSEEFIDGRWEKFTGV